MYEYFVINKRESMLIRMCWEAQEREASYASRNIRASVVQLSVKPSHVSHVRFSSHCVNLDRESRA
jgi:hypothetical protein